MKYWLIASLVLVLVVTGIFGVNALISNSTIDSQATTQSGCKSCNGGCTADSNCGLSLCGAASGKECTCGKTTSCNGSCTTGSSCGSAGCDAKTTSGCGCNK